MKKTNMLFEKKGYSLIVLIIVIIVIILLAMVSVSSLRTSREKTMATNFIYDLNTVEEAVKNFYTSKGTLPTLSNTPYSIYDIIDTYAIPEIGSQLSNEDDENYYFVDLSKLQGVALKDTSRQYFVNNGSQTVYVVVPLKYQKSDNVESKSYYTLTPDLVEGRDVYDSMEEDIEIVGIPINWATKADLRVVLPKRPLSETNWNRWTFRFSIGPKTQDAMEASGINVTKYKRPEQLDSGEVIDTTKVVEFDYGDLITLKTNGTYTFYIKEPDEGSQKGKVTIKNINIGMIDDIKPKYEFLNNGSKFYAVDNETGIKEIRFKTLKQYRDNVEKAANGVDEYSGDRTNLDYYLIDGKGKDLIYNLEAEIKAYIKEVDEINAAIKAENDRYNSYIETNKVDNIYITQEDIDSEYENHINIINNLNSKLNDLHNEYPYLYDVDGKTEDSRLVVFITDNADNALVVGDTAFLSTRILANSYNIELGVLGD